MDVWRVMVEVMLLLSCQRKFQKQSFILSSHVKFQDGMREEFSLLRAA